MVVCRACLYTVIVQSGGGAVACGRALLIQPLRKMFIRKYMI